MSERDGFQAGVPCWVAAVLPDPEAGVAFYTELFGWEAADIMPPDGPGRYYVCTLGGRAVPAWVNEGLATVLEPAGSKDLEAVLTRTNDGPALSKLHRSFVGLSVRDAEVAYASAARAVRRLIEQHGTSALVALLKDLSQGAPFDDAFQKRTAMKYDDFEALVARK